MKGLILLKKVFMGLILLLVMTGCQERTKVSQNNSQEYSLIDNQNDKSHDIVTDLGEERMNQIIITIDDQDFSITLEQNESVAAFVKQLPMTITMDELHGNEKYFYMAQKLPSQSQALDYIKAGDFMLYGNDCLVLFYENFSTTYSYTRLGHVDDVDGFVSKVGSGSINVTIQQ